MLVEIHVEVRMHVLLEQEALALQHGRKLAWRQLVHAKELDIVVESKPAATCSRAVPRSATLPTTSATRPEKSARRESAPAWV